MFAVDHHPATSLGPDRTTTRNTPSRGITLVSVSRTSALGAIALSGALALSACASENNGSAPAAGSTGAAAGSTAAGDCFSGDLKAEGSSAQKNAIDEAIKAYQNACSEANIDYQPTGSGAGIKQFIAKQVDFAGSDSSLKTTPKDGKVEAQEAKASCGSEAWNIPM